MKLEINGTTYQVPRAYEQAIVDQLVHRELLPWYENLDKRWKVMGQLASRGVLFFMEKKVEAEAPEKALLLRPPTRDADPNLHLVRVFAGMLSEGLKHVTVHCETGLDAADQSPVIAAFNVQVTTPGVDTATALTNQSEAG